MSANRLLTKLIFVAAFLVLAATTTPLVRAQGSGVEALALPPVEVERIIKSFTTKEREFRLALNQ